MVPDNKPKIVIIEQQPILREGIVALLSEAMPDMEVLSKDNFPDGISHIENKAVRLVICEFMVDGDTAHSVLRRIKVARLNTRCLILSALDEILVGHACMRDGASGFVAKSAPVAHLVEAARTVLAGRHYLSERLSKALMNGGEPSPSAPQPLSPSAPQLTPRELQIFSLSGQGLGVSLIARKLSISVKTVESHRENIKNKLGYQNSSQLTAAAVRWIENTYVTI